MKIQWKSFCAVAALAVASTCSIAQMPMDHPSSDVAPGSAVAPSKALDALISVIEGEMMGAVKAMPAEKFSFAPSSATFATSQETDFKGVRTFAEQAAHVAQANYYFYSTISGLKPDVDMGGVGKLTSKEDVVKALAGSFAFAHKAVATLTAANAFEALKPAEPGMLTTKSSLAAFGVAHAFDHYGQMVEYLRMNGIVPPASAK